jgi:hypothetical protein
LASFIALYRGESIGAARLIAATANPEVVREFAERLLAEPEEQEQEAVLQELENGRRRVLRLVRNEGE